MRFPADHGADLPGGLFAWLRKVLSDEIVARTTESQGPTPIGSDSAPNPAPKADVGSNGGEPTKAELYERAQELGIEGRSRCPRPSCSARSAKPAAESRGDRARPG